MSITVTELKTPTSSKTGDSESASREFMIAGDASTPVTSEQMALAQPNVPKKGDPHPNRPTLLADGWEVTHREEAGAGYAWVIRWNYIPLPPISIVPENNPPEGEIGYTEINLSVHSEWIDHWRQRGSYTLPTDKDDPPKTDIGGTAIDSAGEPVSAAIRMMQADIKQIVPSAKLSVISGLTNKRNSRTFLGGVAGKVLYKSADLARVDTEKWEATHHFAWDEDFHLRQVAKRNGQDGEVDLTETTTDIYNAATVWMVQPYGETADFGVLGLRY